MFADIFKSFYTSESDVNRVIELLNKYNISYDINDVFVNWFWIWRVICGNEDDGMNTVNLSDMIFLLF